VATRSDRIFGNLSRFNRDRPVGEITGGDSSYKETKLKKSGRVADETVAPMMIVQHNTIVGKGLC